MSFLIFRILVLLWNNSPRGLQKLLRLTGLPQFVVDVWMPFRDIPIPPTETDVKRIIENVVQPGWTCADVGANYGIMTEVIVASVRNPLHVLEAAECGAHIATIPYSVLQQMIKHPLTDIGIQKFLDDWKKVPGR